MKLYLYLILVICFISCKQETKESSSVTKEAKIQPTDFSWLVGSWKRVGEKGGKQTYETWNKEDDSTYIGMSCTLKNGDTTWREDIVLSLNEDSWDFAVSLMGNDEPTVFNLTTIEKEKFICENEANDFPKKIEYHREGKNLNAVISGGGPSIPFNYVPSNY